MTRSELYHLPHLWWLAQICCLHSCEHHRLAACLHYRSALNEIASVWFKSIFEYHLHYYSLLAKKPKPTITIFIKVKIVDGAKGLVCHYYRKVNKHGKALSVGDRLSTWWHLLTIYSHAYLQIFLLFLKPPCCLNSILLLQFITVVVILAVVLHIFIPFIRAKSNCRIATVYTTK